MSIACIFRGHDYRRVGDIKPIKSASSFSHNDYQGHYAMGRCAVCGKESLRQCFGEFRWSMHERVTAAEYNRAFANGELSSTEEAANANPMA